jgi:UDP-galactopyranose mutase
MTADYIVVGAGLTGATIARLLTDAGRDVIVLERRSHAGGNVHDFLHESGIRIHTYGPHYFRTGSRRIWEYATRFARFYSFEARVLTQVDGRYEHWPVVASYLARTVGPSWSPEFTGTPTNFEEACLSMMPRRIFDKFVKGYTEKQWGVPTTVLAPGLARRFDVRADDETRLFRHPHQGLPAEGYQRWMSQMLDGVTTVTGVDYLQERSAWRHRRWLIFTGSLDEFFGFRLGRLKYRRQQRCHVYDATAGYLLPCVQVNNPNGPPDSHIRQIEWKHLMEPAHAASVAGTVVTSETPSTAEEPDTYEYPFPDAENQDRYSRYVRMAAAVPHFLWCGRLGEYKYYDMDQAIGRAMVLARVLLREEAPRCLSRPA